MTIVFLSNYFNHHQAFLCENLNTLTNGNFYFIGTEPMSDERKKLGWEISSFPKYVKNAYINKETTNICKKLINDADVVIIGSAPSKFIRERLSKGKLTFRYSERLLKKKNLLRIIGYTLKTWITNGWHKSFYLLCASAYTASDYHRMFSFRNKCFKWGYFPETKIYDDIKTVILKKSTFSILWVARLIEWKHPEVPIKIVKRLKDSGYRVNLSIIGNGPLQTRIENMIEELDLKNEVHLLGALKPTEVRKYMEKSEIFLFTSDRNEGWGAVLNEAMNSGCAVVASHKIGSVPYLINDKENGLIYKDGDLQDLYTKTKLLLDKKNLQVSLGIRAYETIVNLWSPQNAAKRLIQLIEEINKNNDTPFVTGPCSKAETLSDNWK